MAVGVTVPTVAGAVVSPVIVTEAVEKSEITPSLLREAMRKLY